MLAGGGPGRTVGCAQMDLGCTSGGPFMDPVRTPCAWYRKQGPSPGQTGPDGSAITNLVLPGWFIAQSGGGWREQAQMRCLAAGRQRRSARGCAEPVASQAGLTLRNAIGRGSQGAPPRPWD
jgi:hypothetical protein